MKEGEVTAKLKRIHTGQNTRGQTHKGTAHLPKYPRKIGPPRTSKTTTGLSGLPPLPTGVNPSESTADGDFLSSAPSRGIATIGVVSGV